MQSLAKSIDDAALSTNVKVVSIYYLCNFLYNSAYDITDYANEKKSFFSCILTEKNSTVNTNVLCCNTDNCNHGVKQWANSILLTMTATAAALTTFILL